MAMEHHAQDQVPTSLLHVDLGGFVVRALEGAPGLAPDGGCPMGGEPVKKSILHVPVERKMVCRQGAKPLCKWPRCVCPVDLVYMTDCHIPRPVRK